MRQYCKHPNVIARISLHAGETTKLGLSLKLEFGIGQLLRKTALTIEMYHILETIFDRVKSNNSVLKHILKKLKFSVLCAHTHIFHSLRKKTE